MSHQRNDITWTHLVLISLRLCLLADRDAQHDASVPFLLSSITTHPGPPPPLPFRQTAKYLSDAAVCSYPNSTHTGLPPALPFWQAAVNALANATASGRAVGSNAFSADYDREAGTLVGAMAALKTCGVGSHVAGSRLARLDELRGWHIGGCNSSIRNRWDFSLPGSRIGIY